VQVPTVLFSGISGVLVDRVSKRAILVGTNLIRVVGVLGYLAFQKHLIALYIITFVVAVISQPFAPAEGSALPLLVRGEQLITANSLFQLTFIASQGVGFAIAPVAIGLLGMPTTLVILAIMFGLAALVLIPLPTVVDKRLRRRICLRQKRQCASGTISRRLCNLSFEIVHSRSRCSKFPWLPPCCSSLPK
jgi:MFS family permease